MNRDKVLDEIILAYRNVIEERYQYNVLSKEYKLPNAIDKKTINNIKTYFLHYVYPDLEQRAELDDAFSTLDDFIKQPKKLLNLVLESFKLIFSHGKHLPQIFNAGLKAMKSFRGATKFENRLVDMALDKKISYPYSTDKIDTLIKLLPYSEIEEFIKSTESFFNIIHDKNLVIKVKEIITFLINKMKKKPKIFSTKEISGLILALKTISKGEEMLSKLSEENQKILIGYVVKIEKDNLNKIFSK